MDIKIQLLPLLSWQGRLRHHLRNLSNRFYLKMSGRVSSALRASHAVFCATRQDLRNLAPLSDKPLYLLRENSVRMQCEDEPFPSGPLRLVWVGRVECAKGIDLLLGALLLLPRDLAWRASVVGGGPDVERCRKICSDNGISDRIDWMGVLPRDDVTEVMRGSHVHLITSAMEGMPTVLFEALEVGVPTISVDAYGMSDVISPDIGIKIPLASIETMQTAIAIELASLASEPDRLMSFRSSIRARFAELCWDGEVAKVAAAYRSVSSNA